MKNGNWKSPHVATLILAALAMTAAPAIATPSIAETGQAAASPAGNRITGTVTAISGTTLTVKDDKGVESKVTVPDAARLLQLPAGSKSLSAATPIKLQDIAVGDRILAKVSADGAASTLIAMKQADVAQKQQQDREDWQKRGISGVVKAIDPSSQIITVSTGSGPAAKSLAVQASKTTVVRRYSPESTKFDEAKTATLDQIKPGDELRAKGDKNADGTQLTAEEIVAGTFHNIAGTVISVDPAAYTMTVADLKTKSPFTININSDSQLHKLSEPMARGMAARLKGGGGGAPGGPRQAAANAPADAPGNGGQGRPTPEAGSSPQGPPSGTDAGPGGQHGGGGGADIQNVLNRAPVLQLADLKKGDAIMVLTTEGRSPNEATAITLLAGVEPLLEASPNSSQSVLSASWNLSGGGQEAAAQ